jgi:uncharacterized protein (DUF427 family)
MAQAFIEDDNGNRIILAQSDDTIRIEGNHYFPPDSVSKEYLTPSQTHTTCPWKGEASYKNVEVGNTKLLDAAWTYPNPKAGSTERVGQDFAHYWAFWRGVHVIDR